MAQDTLLGFPAHILPYRFLDSLRQGKHLPFRPVLTSFWKGALLVEKRIDRVIFTCGGTAGHVNPAIAVAQLMAEKNPQIKILFVGAERGLEKDLIPKAGYEFRTVHISSFHRSLKPAEIKHNLVSLYNMVRSPAEARAILKEFRPDAVIGTGGYASYPTVKAAAKMGIPTAVHESNAVPGLTTELLEPYAGRIMVGFESCRQHYKHPEKVAVTGTPVREDFFTLTKEAAKEKLGVNDGRPLIVSFWGSLGASGMNAQMADMLALEAGKEPFHHIHGAGKSGYAAVLKALAEKGVDLKDHPSLQVREYIYDMAPVMRAADLVICRAGASTVSELTALGVPAIMVPSPYVTNNHQEKNARALETHGGVEVLLEQDSSGQALFQTAAGILHDDVRREAMASGHGGIGHPGCGPANLRNRSGVAVNLLFRTLHQPIAVIKYQRNRKIDGESALYPRKRQAFSPFDKAAAGTEVALSP